jgi:anti-sigma B factor antagonist
MYRPTVHPGLRVPVSRNETGSGNTILGIYPPSEPSLWERRVAELRFSMETHGTAVVVSAHGELDITSSQRFDERLSEAAAASNQVILDMSAVDFMDTTALAVIVTHWRRQAEEGGVFLLAGARYRYTKALWITGLADRLPMYDTVGEAVAALAGTGSGAANGPGASEPGELGKPEATAG